MQNESDIGGTYAPVIRGTSIKMLLSYALNNDFEIHHVDIKNAYLNAPLKEEVYIEQPYGYESKSDKKLVCKLHKAMYSLKQAARCWGELLTELLTDMKFKQFESEECIYANEGSEIVIGVYVDDLIIMSKSVEAIVKFKQQLAEKVRLTDNGKLTKFIGFDVKRTDDEIHLSQEDLIQELIENCGLQNANGVRTPLSTGTILDAEEGDIQCEEVKNYQSIIGSLMYIAGCTRPDIQYVSNKLGRYMSNPMEKHFSAAKKVVRYLKQTAATKTDFQET